MSEPTKNPIAQSMFEQICLIGAMLKYIDDTLMTTEFLLKEMSDDGMLKQIRNDGVDLMNNQMKSYASLNEVIHQTDLINDLTEENKQILLTLHGYVINIHERMLKRYSKQKTTEVIPINQKVH